MVFLNIMAGTVSAFLMVLILCMFARAITSWFPIDEESPVIRFLYAITEPVIYPMRVLLGRSELVQSIPIDIPFFLTMMLIYFVYALLQFTV